MDGQPADGVAFNGKIKQHKQQQQHREPPQRASCVMREAHISKNSIVL